MSLTNLPVEDIEQMAATVKQQSQEILAKLSQLRSACQRDPSFTGSAADRYDEYMEQWDTHQKALTDNLEGAGELLTRYAAKLHEVNGLVTFDI